MMTRCFLSRFFCLLIFILTAGCAAKAASPANSSSDPATFPTLPSTALLQVIRADGSATPFSLEDLKKLPAVQADFGDGKFQDGPKISEVLNAAGVKTYSSVTIQGSNGELTITPEQMADSTMLDFTNRGTVKMASKAFPKTGWVKDIYQMVVK
jgi:hypothetical protein